MKSNWFFPVMISLCCLPVRSEVEIQSSINDVYRLGSHELPGFIGVKISGDHFGPVTENAPYFLRLALNQNSFLADTLVDLTSSDPAINSPIYLALELNNGVNPDRFMNAPANAVSVVRWVQGEPYLWIRIQASSSTWVGVPGQSPVPPSDDDEVCFEIGISARSNFERDLQPQTSNLPYNTRNLGAQYGVTTDATSILICADLSKSTLSDTGVESLLGMDAIFFDATAEVIPGVYQAGNDVGIIIFGDLIIARGRNRQCQVTPNLLMPSETVALGGGFSQTKAFLDLDVFCTSGGTFLFNIGGEGFGLSIQSRSCRSHGF